MNDRVRKISYICVLAMLSAAISGCAAGTDDKVRTQTGEAADSTEQPLEVYSPTLPSGEENSSIYIQKIDDLPEDFIMGMDISSLLAEEASGVKYHDEQGNEQDLLKLLADAGINCVRVRVWVDPFDSEGHGYGGGNCNAQTAAEIGKRAAAYGIGLCVDFHYSDFWADPAKQMVPKAWADYDTDGKAEAIAAYTEESLRTILASGADVTMVQVGNEINNGMSGEKGLNNKLKLLKAGCAAVRKIAGETDRDIAIVLHYTQIDDYKNIMEIARQLKSAKVDYDVFGVSYYPYWHGTMENMTQVLTDISKEYGVKICIMETSYPYTDADGDGTANSVSGTSLKLSYPVSVQGQANCIRDIMAAGVTGGAIGLFYWEGAWIPVGSDPSTNKAIWETYGSGWASSYASEYDPDDAGRYYGGSSWDNQAMFDFDGVKLPSLDVFKYVRYGAVGEKLAITTDLTDIVSVDVSIGGEVILPDEVEVKYNDTSVTSPLKLHWDEDELAVIDTDKADVYNIPVKGTTDAIPDEEYEFIATVRVANINYVVNPGFEDNADGAPWTAAALDGGSAPTDIQDKEADAYDGTKAFHYYNVKDFDFEVQQEISDIPTGTYRLTSYIQGGDMGENAVIYMYAVVGGDMVYESEPVTVDGWQQWKKAEILNISVTDADTVSVGYHIESAGGGWGTIDAFELSLQN